MKRDCIFAIIFSIFLLLNKGWEVGLLIIIAFIYFYFEYKKTQLFIEKYYDKIIIQDRTYTKEIPLKQLKSITSNIKISKNDSVIEHSIIFQTTTDEYIISVPPSPYLYAKIDCAEILDLLKSNLPNYNFKLTGDNVDYIVKDINYFNKYKKRLSLFKRFLLYFKEVDIISKILILYMLVCLLLLFFSLIIIYTSQHAGHIILSY